MAYANAQEALRALKSKTAPAAIVVKKTLPAAAGKKFPKG